jgi:hypothetical protein
MRRPRFDFIWKHLRFSHQPPELPPIMSSEKYRWMLIAYHVSAFNNQRKGQILVSD